MEFGEVPVAEAEGAILAHSQATEQGRLRKGTVLGPDDLAALDAAGVAHVAVARPGADDMDENAAAAALAEALVPDPHAAGLRLTRAATGRVNLIATGPGVLRLDAAAIHRVNAGDPMVTVATLPPFARVAEGTMVATVKIIAYAVPRTSVATAAEAGRAALSVAPVVLNGASLIITEMGQGPGKGEAAMEARLARLGMALDRVEVVPHEIAPIAAALRSVTSDLALLLTASATSDIADTGPEAVRAAGGEITRFGMPVDPGNLLFLGRIGDRPVIGLPGCARSPALNGADWVLERVCCGLPPGPEEIAAMGVGGLLKESPARPHPRTKRAAQ